MKINYIFSCASHLSQISGLYNNLSVFGNINYSELKNKSLKIVEIRKLKII